MAEDFTTRTPGQLLRAARQQQERSLQEAYEGTKIPVRLLEAIERDEYHKLSGPLYVKSFLRNYAGWLGLDPEKILSVYELATGRPEPTPSADDEVWSEDQVAVTRVGVPWGRLVGIAVGVVVALAVLVVLAIRIFGGGEEPAVDGAGGRPPREVPEQRTVVTRADGGGEPQAQEPAPAPADDEGAGTSGAAGTTVTERGEDPTAAIPDGETMETSAREAGSPPGIRSKVQPREREETGQERLARLNRDHLGGLQPEEPAVEPVPDGAATVIATPAAPPARDLPPPRRGDPELRFRGGEQFPLVLRVVMPEPANCSVRRDDQADAVPVIWPDQPSAPPAYNLRHGVAYAVRGGYAIYWGAEDHFTLTLGRVGGVEVTVNGHPQALGDWRPGQTKLLDRSSLPDGG